MKMKFFAASVLLTLSVLFTGCFTSVDGHTKGGLPFSKDKITSRYERNVDQIATASREVLKRNGQIVADDAITHSLHAKVDTRNVWVKISKVDEKVTEVIVQTRTKGGRGDVDLASELSKQIGIQLAVNQ